MGSNICKNVQEKDAQMATKKTDQIAKEKESNVITNKSVTNKPNNENKSYDQNQMKNTISTHQTKIFKSFFSNGGHSTLSYMIGDPTTNEVALIDSVKEDLQIYIDFIKTHNLKLKYLLETHVHADHVTATYDLRREFPEAQICVSQAAGAEHVDVHLADNQTLKLGAVELTVLHTPGHTATCVCYALDDRVFTGDTLLIGGCGRTDFQSGSARTLWHSIQRVLRLDPGTLVYPAHNYNGLRVSTVEQELLSNPRVSGKTESEFVEIMQNLALPKPKLIDIAVPANMKSGNV
eukprot:Mrub_06942.p1 GENE.Mrub_06942~~Mrub_06942.p1  ORF type:complete len:292 (-),score=113.00 Mrub_06942:88-963(-)